VQRHSRREFLGAAGAAAAAAASSLRAAEAPKGWTAQKARHWSALPDGRVICELCPNGCRIDDGGRGDCRVRENRKGELQTLVHSRACSLHVDPIEKKPMFHYMPGSVALSVATPGCNFTCRFCQNWQISQFPPERVECTHVTPDDLVKAAKAQGAPTIAYTYSEPVVFYEYMYDTAKAGRKAGVGSVMISNGFIEKQPLSELCEHLTGVKVDLKAFTEDFYRKTCSGRLQPVLDSLQTLRKLGMWTEIVVLLVPTLNDSEDETRQMCKWVVENLGPDVPMHFSRFHPTYMLKELPPTPVETVVRAREIASAEGVHFAYVGNVSPHKYENTYCPGCGRVLIRRIGYVVRENALADGRCPDCQTAIPGVWKNPASS